MLLMKEQGKNLQDQQSEEKIGNLPEKEFRVMIVNMIQDLGKRKEAWIEKIKEMFNKGLETKEQTNSDEQCNNQNEKRLEGINSRITEAEEQISELEDRIVEITAVEQNKKKRIKRNEDNLRDL